MTGQGQFGVDDAAPLKAIGKLEDARDKARQLMVEANSMEPGELTAKDGTTGNARLNFQNRLNGDETSLRMSADGIR